MKSESFKMFLAPMAETSTPALRHIVKRFCPEVILFSEMLSAGAIVSGASHNEPMVNKHSFDNPLIYQIVGSSPEVMRDACGILSEKGCYSVDINMGCPNHEIVKKGQGARLLTDMDKTRKIIRACRKSAKSKLSVKMRSGYEKNDESHFVKFIKMLEDEGIDFITVHPRFAKLSFKRKADWRLISLAKRNISIPLIGNGDISSPEMFLQKKNETGCDGIMIGREAVKSPWIFRLCSDILAGKDSLLEVNVHDIFIKILDLIKSYLPEHLHKSRSHRFCFYFSKNAKFSHDLFRKIRQTNKIDNIKEIIDAYYQRNKSENVIVIGNITVNK